MPTDETLVLRPSPRIWFKGPIYAVPFVAIGLFALVIEPKPLVAAASFVIAVLILSTSWRSVRVTSSDLIAQGRFSRRRVPLSDVTQIGLGTAGIPFVAHRGGKAFYLKMASPSRYADVHGVDGLIDELRRRATAAGAQLGPRVRGRSAVPRPASGLFSL